MFPTPHAISVRYELDDVLPGLFDLLEAALDPGGPDAIFFARYTPDLYLRIQVEAEEYARAQGLAGLLRSGILKRFESSIYAFKKTITKMAHEHQIFLDALDAGIVLTTDLLRELSGDDEAAFEDMVNGASPSLSAKFYDTDRLRQDVTRDCNILRELAGKADEVKATRDPKLKALLDELKSIARQAEHEASSEADEAQKRKVLVFSFFEDTVEWIRDFLRQHLCQSDELLPYRERIVSVSGSGDLDEVSRKDAVEGFAPASMKTHSAPKDDRYDILISTDVLAEGVNLQQCRHIINFDMPWNPMRLVQRHGRIDRIGSPHSRVYVRTVFPVDRLDRLLSLEQRILDKLAMAAASVGVDAPIEGSARGCQVFAETREEIEKLLQENADLFERGGTESATQSGEEYRQTLRKAMEHNQDRIASLPWKIGSGMVKGHRRGIFYCAVVGERTFLRLVLADKHWEFAGGEESVIREIGTCLRAIECKPETPLSFPDSLRDRAYEFWNIAQEDILSDWMKATDPINLQPKVRPLNRRVAEFIRANQPTEIISEEIENALDILESPWPRREEMMLREWFERSDQDGPALSRIIIKEVLKAGIEAVKPPEPLPPIQREDIQLLCWIGIEAVP